MGSKSNRFPYQPTKTLPDYFQEKTIAVKNPKLDSNSALAKKRRAKTAGGGAAPPTIQEQITQESMEVSSS